MGIVERRRDLAQVGGGLGRGEAPGETARVVQATPGDVGHDEVGEVLALAVVVEAEDMGMFQTGDQAGLGGEAVEEGRGIGTDLNFEPTEQEQAAFGVSVNDWPAFADSPAALDQLKQRFKLGVITNCDDDLFAASNEKLQTEFDWVITAQQAEGYKPRIENFEYAFARIDVPRERVLHVAQSLFHDHVPAKALGMTTVWIDRREGREGGATPPAAAVPDMTFPDLQRFADRAAA
jgi:2-haloacid dehalogenase